MKRIVLSTALWLLASCGLASAQAPVQLCYTPANSPTSCFPVNAANPLPVTGGIGGAGLAVSQTGLASTKSVAAPTAGAFGTLLVSNSARKACTIQNVGTTLGYVYPGAAGGTTANSFQISAGGTFSCTNNTITLTDGVTGTCASSTCAFVISEQ